MCPLLLNIIKDGKKRYGPKAWSSMIVKRLEDDCDLALREEGFPSKLLDIESFSKGSEI